ncbi:hypothetical protein LC605_26805 [Nostoc sp. CHAB 5836]|uniref:hypothetical protein n=1 Tax=Nostoc sp. CHAB 5836 TaxID=2780404 RepID=UPI001E54FF63|nr:hypothetical protein [Nostoc sp. CHAB 5836]MCC5618635.1 hypothetical protein [Nostoc sp. CHAB 5836]
MKPLALTSSLLAIVGSVVSLTLPATAINAAFFAKTTQNLSLPITGGQELRLAEILLPRGKWIVNYSATAVNYGANNVVRCYVRARETGEILSIHATVVGGVQLGASAATTISGVTLVNLNEPTRMVLTCTQDQNGVTAYIDAGAEIVAY